MRLSGRICAQRSRPRNGRASMLPRCGVPMGDEARGRARRRAAQISARDEPAHAVRDERHRAAPVAARIASIFAAGLLGEDVDRGKRRPVGQRVDGAEPSRPEMALQTHATRRHCTARRAPAAAAGSPRAGAGSGIRQPIAGSSAASSSASGGTRRRKSRAARQRQAGPRAAAASGTSQRQREPADAAAHGNRAGKTSGTPATNRQRAQAAREAVAAAQTTYASGRRSPRAKRDRGHMRAMRIPARAQSASGRGGRATCESGSAAARIRTSVRRATTDCEDHRRRRASPTRRRNRSARRASARATRDRAGGSAPCRSGTGRLFTCRLVGCSGLPARRGLAISTPILANARCASSPRARSRAS